MNVGEGQIYFLGGGNMVEAMVRGSFLVPSLSVTVIEKKAQRRQELRKRYPNIKICDRLNCLLDRHDIIFIGVKPQDIQKALLDFAPADALVVSMVSGIRLKSLNHMIGKDVRIIRMMPNLPCGVKKGVYGLYSGAQVLKEDEVRLENLLSSSGLCLWLDKEDLLHSVTALSGSGPGYIFYMMQACFTAAQTLGVSDEVAKILVARAFLGASSMAESAIETGFEQMQQQVTSPNGTTAAAIEVFEKYQLNQIIEKAIKASALRSEEIGKTVQ